MFKFSIITATYNRINNLKFLHSCLIKNKNDLFNIEWILIVEEKDIETISFLRSISKKKIIIKIIKNNYPDQFNKLIKQGIKNSTGDYIIFLGDDDIIKKNALVNIFKFIKKNSSEWVVMPAHYHDPKKKKIRIFVTWIKHKLILLNFVYLLKLINYFMAPAVVTSRNLMFKVNYFKDSVGSSNDWTTWLDISKNNKPDVFNKYYFSVGYNPNTISGSFNFQKYYFLFKIIFTRNYDLITKFFCSSLILVTLLSNTFFKFYNFLISLFNKKNIIYEKKRIVHIVRSFNQIHQTGGIEQFIYQLTQKSKYRSDVISYNNKTDKKIVYKNFDLNLFKVSINIFNDFFSFNALKFLINHAADYKIIHLHHPHPFSFFYILLLPFKKKIILTYHSDIMKYKYIRWVSNLIQSYTNCLIDIYHFSSKKYKISCDFKNIKNYFIESFAINKKNIKKENISINLIKNLPKKYILFIGRNRHYKGFDKLEKIILLNLNINFVCITDFKFNFKSKNLKRYTNVNEDEKKYLIKNSFLNICTSDNRAESFGFSILESLSYSVPVITFKLNSGTNFLIKNNFNGYIINNFNIKLFSKKINDLYNNSKLYKLFRKNTYLDYKKRLDHNYEILDKKYSQLLNS